MSLLTMYFIIVATKPIYTIPYQVILVKYRHSRNKNTLSLPLSPSVVPLFLTLLNTGDEVGKFLTGREAPSLLSMGREQKAAGP